MEKALTVNEVAELLNVHPKTVYNLLDRHELQGVKVGRIWRIPAEILEEYIRKNSYFDTPLTSEESRVCESAWQDYLTGRDQGESIAKVKKDLLGDNHG